MIKSKDYNEKDFNCSRRERDDDIVDGELLKIAKKFEAFSVTIDGIPTPFQSPCMSSSRFMQDGCRANGFLQRSGSLSKLFDEINDYLRGLESCEEAVKNRRVIAQKMLALLDGYQTCPECKGNRGELLGPNYFSDCGTCDGQGMIVNG